MCMNVHLCTYICMYERVCEQLSWRNPRLISTTYVHTYVQWNPANIRELTFVPYKKMS